MMPSGGEFARLYEDLGGTAQYVGKPYPDNYTHGLTRYSATDPRRTITVGDSLYTRSIHDVCGGARLKELARDFGAAPD